MRRWVIAALVLGVFGFWMGPVLIRQLGGASRRSPEQLARGLSEAAHELLGRASEGVSNPCDYHVHLAGLGGQGSGAYVHPDLLSWLHPRAHLRFLVYASAAGIEDLTNAEDLYLDRLANLARYLPHPSRILLLPMDQFHTALGEARPDQTEFFVPNSFALSAADRLGESFAAAVSIHPYRPDAVERLEHFSERGIRFVKWLPNSMGIDPSDERCQPFYEVMKAKDLILLTHAGEEQAVEAEEYQKLGNPLLLRRPLRAGVKVIVAHCAGLGSNADLDLESPDERSNFELFLRLFEEREFEGLLFGEISAMTQFNRLGAPLKTLLERPELHGRLVNGSDYPLPAINLLIQTRALLRDGWITAEERQLLNEIYDYNPLLFDFAVKRTLRHPETSAQLPAEVFEEHPALLLKAASDG
jgi:mannonate dehydratase